MTCSPVELNLLFSQAIVVRTVAISYNVELLPTCKCWICVCVCVCIVVLGMCSQSKLFVRGREGEVWGVGDCDSSAPLHTTVLSCTLLYCAVCH